MLCDVVKRRSLDANILNQITTVGAERPRADWKQIHADKFVRWSTPQGENFQQQMNQCVAGVKRFIANEQRRAKRGAANERTMIVCVLLFETCMQIGREFIT